MRLYLGGKMLDVPGFGFDVFDTCAASLRSLGHEIFNPADRDRDSGLNTTGMKGTHAELEAAGFSRRESLTYDWWWIGSFSQGMVVIDSTPWQTSTGTISEIAAHQALYLPVWFYSDFMALHDTHWQLKECILPSLLELGSRRAISTWA